MRQLVSLTVVALSLLTLAACKNPKPRGRIDRAARPGEKAKGGGVTGTFAQKALEGSKACLSLEGINTALQSTDASTFTVYVQDIDFVEFQKDACPPFKKTEADVALSRALVAKTATLFKAHLPESLAQDADYLNLKDQTACEKAEFNDGRKFTVVCQPTPVNPAKVRLMSEDQLEYRAYDLDSSGLTVTIYKRTDNVPTCKNDTSIRELWQKTRIKVVPGDLTTVRLQTTLAQILQANAKTPPKWVATTLKGALDKDGKVKNEETTLPVGSLVNLQEQISNAAICFKP